MSIHEDIEIPQVTLGLRLHMAMRRAGLSRADMADLMHVSAATITRWTNDKGDGPKRIYLERWADVCRVPLEWLAGELFHDPTAVPLPRRRASDINPRTTGDLDRYSHPLLACSGL